MIGQDHTTEPMGVTMGNTLVERKVTMYGVESPLSSEVGTLEIWQYTKLLSVHLY